MKRTPRACVHEHRALLLGLYSLSTYLTANTAREMQVSQSPWTNSDFVRQGLYNVLAEYANHLCPFPLISSQCHQQCYEIHSPSTAAKGHRSWKGCSGLSRHLVGSSHCAVNINDQI